MGRRKGEEEADEKEAGESLLDNGTGHQTMSAWW